MKQLREIRGIWGLDKAFPERERGELVCGKFPMSEGKLGLVTKLISP